jgi:hypothetical protein
MVMDQDYYSVEAILAENQVSQSRRSALEKKLNAQLQKIPCTFKVDIPDMGHLTASSERDVGPSHNDRYPTPTPRLTDQSTEQSDHATMASLPFNLLVSLLSFACSSYVPTLTAIGPSSTYHPHSIQKYETRLKRKPNRLNYRLKLVPGALGMDSEKRLWICRYLLFAFGVSLLTVGTERLGDAQAIDISTTLTKVRLHNLFQKSSYIDVRRSVIASWK